MLQQRQKEQLVRGVRGVKQPQGASFGKEVMSPRGPNIKNLQIWVTEYGIYCTILFTSVFWNFSY